GNPEHPITAGFTCAKIKDHIKRLQSSDRILKPMLRSDNGWQAISWDQALDLCAQQIQQLRNEPKAILHIHGSGAKGVLKEAAAFLFNQLGTSRTWGSLCDAAGYMACIRDFGSRKNNHINDLLNAAAIVNWGKDVSRSSVHTAAIVRKARRNGTRVLTISPGGDDSEGFSDGHLRIRPGTDRFLAAAAILRLVRGDLIPEHILKQTKDPQKFLSLITGHSQAQLLDACDVPENDLERLFEVYASGKPAATLVGTGLQRYAYGAENVRFINALALLSGHIGVSGGGSYYQLHAYRNLDLKWIEGDQRKPRRSFPLPAIAGEILAARSPAVKMIWVNCINVVNQAPDSRKIIRAFEQVDFKVVVDAFFNDTVRQADLVLPAKLMLEQEDIIGSFLHEYVQYVPAVLDAPGEARDDHRILSEVAQRLDPPVDLPDQDTCLSKALDSQYLNVSLEQIRTQNSVCSNRPEIAYADLQFDHRDGKCRFPSDLHPEPAAPADYPLRLLTLIRRNAQHSQILPGQQKIPPEVWVAPENPALADLNPVRDTYLVSPLGKLAVSLKTMSGLHPQVVLYRRGDWMCQGGGANQLIEARLTDMGSGAAFYSQYVNLIN
ncbi:MAG: molybdopterin-dependent oxidoreductase, partial [Deltaproteobacteria bacterium]|nr:molybdopterin-dependent oxidoreductase [Deltaproteobacteria bacterium]